MPSDCGFEARITILLCTYNGARYLPAQLDSYLAQTGVNWDLWVSDDGSTDDTRDILEEFRKTAGPNRRVHVVEGPRAGSAANYMALLTHPDLPAGPVALSDQDDVWHPDRLHRAANALAEGPAVTLYGAQSLHADADLRVIGRSRPPRRPPSFRNALTQNIVSGHSAALSRGALDVVRRAGRAAIAHHDWWLYQLISGAGGMVTIDPAEVLLYRQHGQNTVGAHRGIGSSLRRARQIMDRVYGDWIEANLAALEKAGEVLTEENRALVTALRSAPARPGLGRPLTLYRHGLHRQTTLTTASVYAAAALGRV